MGDYTTNGYFYLPDAAEEETTGKPLFDAAFEATDEVIHGQFEAFTADDTLTEAESNKVCSNLGATGVVTLTLPQDAVAGVKFYFVIAASYALRIDPGAGGGIYLTGAKRGDGKYIVADAINESIMLVSDGNGDWITLFPSGTWGYEA